MNIFNPEMEIKSIDHPYKIWIIDDFLIPEIPQRILAEWPFSDDQKWFRGIQEVDGKKNLLEQGMLAISSYDKMPSFIGEVFKYFHSPEFTKEIEKITEKDDLLPDETFRWSGMRTMLEGGFQLIHSDARKNPLDGKRKELTLLYYLNENYDKKDSEGCLEVWDDQMTKCIHQIEPLYNRLVIFVCSDTSYHGVPLVKKERRFLTFSIMKNDTVSNRVKALFVARPEDSEEIKEMGQKRSIIIDKS